MWQRVSFPSEALAIMMKCCSGLYCTCCCFIVCMNEAALFVYVVNMLEINVFLQVYMVCFEAIIMHFGRTTYTQSQFSHIEGRTRTLILYCRWVNSPHPCPHSARVTVVHERGRLSWREEEEEEEQAFLVSSLTVLMWKYKRWIIHSQWEVNNEYVRAIKGCMLMSKRESERGGLPPLSDLSPASPNAEELK